MLVGAETVPAEAEVRRRCQRKLELRIRIRIGGLEQESRVVVHVKFSWPDACGQGVTVGNKRLVNLNSACESRSFWQVLSLGCIRCSVGLGSAGIFLLLSSAGRYPLAAVNRVESLSVCLAESVSSVESCGRGPVTVLKSDRV